MVICNDQKFRIVLSDNNAGAYALAFLFLHAPEEVLHLLHAHVCNRDYGRHCIFSNVGYIRGHLAIR